MFEISTANWARRLVLDRLMSVEDLLMLLFFDLEGTLIVLVNSHSDGESGNDSGCVVDSPRSVICVSPPLGGRMCC